MLLATIHRFCDEEGNAKLSFSQFNWFKNFIVQSERLNRKYECKDLTHHITCMLLHLNFNKPCFAGYVLNKLQSRINCCNTVDEQIQLWNRYLLQVKVLNKNSPFCAKHPSLKMLLAQKIKMHIAQLEKETKEQHNNSVAAETIIQPPILTSISVSQLAVMLRLMVDTGMIQYKNHSELIKKIATSFQTPKASVISAESLRTKYYSPDRASLQIVKEYLFKMAGLMKEY